MPSRLLAATFEVTDPVRVARFWAALLGRDVVEIAGVALLFGDHTQLGLAFAQNRVEKSGPNRMHPHLTSASEADQEQTTETALRLGVLATSMSASSRTSVTSFFPTPETTSSA